MICSGLPPRHSPLSVSAPSARAVTSAPGRQVGDHPRCGSTPMAFPIHIVTRLLHPPDVGFCRANGLGAER